MLAEGIDTVLLPRPDVAFRQVAAVIEGLGATRRAGVGGTVAPLLDGEPEVAAWRTPSGADILYTFDPDVRLRRLDVADVPPTGRAAIATGVPLLDPGALAGLLHSASADDRLLGVRAAVAMRRIDLLSALDALVGEDPVVISDAAARAFGALEAEAQDRAATWVRLSLLGKAARPVILGLPGNADAVEALRPTLADAEAACGAWGEPAFEAAEAAFARPIRVPPIGAALDVVAATGALLRGPNEVSRAFANGWRAAAGRLRPDGVWITWRQLPGDVRFDGLFTRGDGRWCWFPKLWRALRDPWPGG